MTAVRARWWLAGTALVVFALVGARLDRHLHHHVLRAGDHLVALRLSSLYGGSYTFAPTARPTVINVFATWCPPCRAETPGFVAAAKGLRAHGVAMVAIDQQESAAAVSRFTQEFAVPYPVYIDSTGITHDLLGARVIPTTIVVDRRGIIVWEHSGPITQAQLLAAISQTENNG